jgi:beta-glucosidase-like glycosyl hydrolase
VDRPSPARLVLPAIRWRTGSGFAQEMDHARRALDRGVGGFILFGGTAESVSRLSRELQEHAGRPLLIGSDLERGAGQQVAGLTEFPPPGALASLGDEAIRQAARTTAAEAREVGINWIFAPVADLDIEPSNPIVQSRSFGADPDLTAHAVRLWVEACQAAGALACAKHYPGHGRTTRDSHAELPTVSDSADSLSMDERPFRSAIEAGVASVMTAHVAFPALDPTGKPATFSEPILRRLRMSGFNGLIVTDALIMEAARRGDEGDAAAEILAAGVDLLLYPSDFERAIGGLENGLTLGRLPQQRVEEALGRYSTALTRAGAPAVTGSRPGADGIADQLLKTGTQRGRAGKLTGPLTLTVIDDDIGGPYPPSPGVLLPAELERIGCLGEGGSRVVLAFAEPRGWKSRAGFSESARQALSAARSADLVVLFGHPRLIGEIPGTAPVLVAWHRQALMQHAVVRWIQRQVGAN